METATFSWTDWHIHPSIASGILCLGLSYLIWINAFRKRYGSQEPSVLAKNLLFFAGLLLLFVALQSPLHDLGDQYLFSAHMTQHMLLILAVAPLLLLGIPGWGMRPLLRYRAMVTLGAYITRPVVAIILFNITLILWHLPGPYQSALEFRGVHIIEHIFFLSAAVIMWWPVLSPADELPRLGPPAQMLYLFVQSLLPAVLGAFITLTNDQLYPFYAEAPRVYDISPLTDQQLGGLIMKIPGTLVYWGFATVIFFSWANREQRIEENAKRKNRLEY